MNYVCMDISSWVDPYSLSCLLMDRSIYILWFSRANLNPFLLNKWDDIIRPIEKTANKIMKNPYTHGTYTLTHSFCKKFKYEFYKPKSEMIPLLSYQRFLNILGHDLNIFAYPFSYYFFAPFSTAALKRVSSD